MKLILSAIVFLGMASAQASDVCELLSGPYQYRTSCTNSADDILIKEGSVSAAEYAKIRITLIKTLLEKGYKMQGHTFIK